MLSLYILVSHNVKEWFVYLHHAPPPPIFAKYIDKQCYRKLDTFIILVLNILLRYLCAIHLLCHVPLRIDLLYKCLCQIQYTCTFSRETCAPPNSWLGSVSFAWPVKQRMQNSDSVNRIVVNINTTTAWTARAWHMISQLRYVRPRGTETEGG